MDHNFLDYISFGYLKDELFKFKSQLATYNIEGQVQYKNH